MATKTVKKTSKEVKEEKPVRNASAAAEASKKVEKYFYALGRRKASIARVKLFVSETGEEAVINGRKVKEYFPTLGMQNSFFAPFKLVPGEPKFRTEISVSGGGRKGQLGASILGIARALVVFNPDFKKVLKAQSLMTRDSRIVERKKPGLKKARKSPQWAKR